MRKKDKIEKYLDRLIKLHNGHMNESSSSRYYFLNGNTIRVSDHFAVNSPCEVSIVLTQDGKYVLTNRKTQTIRCIEYKELLQFCKTFHITHMLTGKVGSYEMEMASMSSIISSKDKEINQLKSQLGTYKNINPNIIKQYKKQITELTNIIKKYKEAKA